MVVHQKAPINTSSNTATRSFLLTPYQHLRNLVNCSCYVCRINYPYSTSGLAAAERVLVGSRLGPMVYLCRDHDRRRAYFCGLCLRDTVITSAQDIGTRDYDLSQAMGIMENEDEKMWDGVDSTCKKCRVEWLWKEASKTPGDREAIGGTSLQSNDWETRQCVEGFIELAEGSIAEVLATAREKVWLKKFTKYDDFGEHALMAQRSNREDGEEEEDSEEDREVMLMRDASQVRDLALHDWSRRRILDGHWVCPADIWYRYQVPGQPLVVPAVHPCPWNQECNADDDADAQHPCTVTVNSEIPPTFSLCEQSYGAFIKQLREILAHPFRNLVRKIVMECAIPTARGYEDPALKASRMSIEEVIAILREEEGIWYDGVDWIERRRNEEESARRAGEAEAAMRLDDDIKDTARLGRLHKEDDSDSTISSSSSPRASSNEGSTKYSDLTSPVLSTTTLQTTPSPPPLTDEGSQDTEKQESLGVPQIWPSKPRIIPIDPVRSQPQPLSSIPYIPVTTVHLPQYSIEALKNVCFVLCFCMYLPTYFFLQVWRDVCAPLYHCRCSICERAKVAEATARAAVAAMNVPVVPSQPRTAQQPVPQIPRTTRSDPPEIVLKEVSEAELDGEGEEEIDEEDLEYDDEEDYEGDESYLVDGEETCRYSASPEIGLLDTNPDSSLATGSPENTTTARKRSSDELDGEEENDSSAYNDDSGDSVSSSHRHRPNGTPPKRARIDAQATTGATQFSATLVDPVFPSSQTSTPVTSTTATASQTPLTATPTPTIRRVKKRSSEELNLDDEGGVQTDGASIGTGGMTTLSSKRAKVDLERPRSLSLAPTSKPSSVGTGRVVGGRENIGCTG